MINERARGSWSKLVATTMTAIVPVVLLGGCGGGSTSNGVPATGFISGTIADSSGNPIGGATVVAGSSSPTAITDKDGNFTIAGVPTGSTTLNTVTGGYNTSSFSVNVINNQTTTIPAVVRLADVDDAANAPVVTKISIQATKSSLSVSASIGVGAGGDAILDARAELIGYGVGSVLTATTGSTYTATITLPSTFVGPSALVKVFAIDAKGRVGEGSGTASVPGASGSGNFTSSTLTGNWAGSLEYHHASLGSNDRFGDRRIANVALSISGGVVTGKFAGMNIESYVAQTWTVTTANFSGTLTLIDAKNGFYEMTSTFTLPSAFNPTATTTTVNLTLIGKLDSATSPSNFLGFLQASVTDTKSDSTLIVGHFHLIDNLTWQTSDLDGSWVLSELIKRTTSTSANYQAPFQYNSAFSLFGGTVSNFSDTLGNSLNSSTAFTMTDPTLGMFSGSMTTADGAVVTFTGLMGNLKKYVVGVYSAALSGTASGSFWGNLIATPPHFATADFGRVKIDRTLGVAIWRGTYLVTGAHDPNALCYLSLWTDSSGNVVGGVIRSILGSACPAGTFTSGSLSFANTTDDGQITGNAKIGTTTTFTLGPAATRNASMGVEKGRLVGDFSVNVTGGTDTGFFFLQRTEIE